MSFAKASIKRFNEFISCAPPPTHYDPRLPRSKSYTLVYKDEPKRMSHQVPSRSKVRNSDGFATPVPLRRPDFESKYKELSSVVANREDEILHLKDSIIEIRVEYEKRINQLQQALAQTDLTTEEKTKTICESLRITYENQIKEKEEKLKNEIDFLKNVLEKTNEEFTSKRCQWEEYENYVQLELVRLNAEYESQLLSKTKPPTNNIVHPELETKLKESESIRQSLLEMIEIQNTDWLNRERHLANKVVFLEGAHTEFRSSFQSLYESVFDEAVDVMSKNFDVMTKEGCLRLKTAFSEFKSKVDEFEKVKKLLNEETVLLDQALIAEKHKREMLQSTLNDMISKDEQLDDQILQLLSEMKVTKSLCFSVFKDLEDIAQHAGAVAELSGRRIINLEEKVEELELMKKALEAEVKEKQIEVSNLASSTSFLQVSLDDLKSMYDRQEETLRLTSSEMTATKNKIKELTNANEAMLQKIEDYHKSRETAEVSIEVLKDELEVKKETLNLAIEDKKRASTEVATLLENLSETKLLLSSLKTEKEEVSEKLKQVELDLEATRDQVEDAQIQLEAFSIQVKLFKEEKEDLEFTLTEKCKLVEELTEKIHKKEKEVQTMKKEKDLVEQIYKDSEAQIMKTVRKLEETVEVKNAEIAAVTKRFESEKRNHAIEIERQQKEIEDLKKKLHCSNEEMIEWIEYENMQENKVKNLQEKYETIKSDFENIQNQNESLKTEMKTITSALESKSLDLEKQNRAAESLWTFFDKVQDDQVLVRDFVGYEKITAFREKLEQYKGNLERQLNESNNSKEDLLQKLDNAEENYNLANEKNIEYKNLLRESKEDNEKLQESMFKLISEHDEIKSKLNDRSLEWEKAIQLANEKGAEYESRLEKSKEENKNLHENISKLQSENNDIKSQLNLRSLELKKAYDLATEMNLKYESNVKGSCEENKKLNENICKLSDENAEIKSRLEEKSLELMRVERLSQESVKKWMTDLRKREEEIKQLKAAILERDKVESDLQRQCSVLGAKLKNEQEKLDNTLSVIKQKDEQIQQLDLCRQKAILDETRCRSIASNLDDVRQKQEMEMKKLIREKKELTEKERKAQEAVEKEQNALSKLKGELDELTIRHDELLKRIEPFMSLINNYEAERKSLVEINQTTESELTALTSRYADLIGHQNNKQKIKHLEKLKLDLFNTKKDLHGVKMELEKEKLMRKRAEESYGELRGESRKLQSQKLAAKTPR
ncbi:hyaluronan mediated motility receptor-like isoform X2 [Artemia franciscana]|uniref:hyaluronan mediated motility receptor-like isoform X2 n=1 Tax=Artemia franciscana TaxID=6661 RepID=UPI0032DB2795